MRKRVKALLLAALMVASMIFTDIPFVNATETANEEANVLVTSATEVKAGEQFTVDIVFPKLAGECYNLEGFFKFDNDAFEIIEFVTSEIDAELLLYDAEDANEYGEIYVAAYTMQDSFSLAEGFTLSVVAKAKDGAKGTYAFSLDHELGGMLVEDVDGEVLFELLEPQSVEIKVVIPVTSVSVQETLELAEGETAVLKATLTPGNTSDVATWSSSDESIAKVDKDGNVTAVKPGEATITVTAGTLSATCKVTVTCSHKDTTKHEKVEPTCTTPGHEAYEVCNTCGELVSGEDKEIAIIAHTLAEIATEEFEVTAPTCTEKGVYYKSCEVCGFKSEETFEVGALGHDFSVEVSEEAATCTTAGTKAHFTCSRCDAVSLDQETACEKTELVIEALGHALKHVEAVAATCDKDGNIEYWTCTTCGKFYADANAETEIIEKETIISATGHKDGGVWSWDENKHWKACGGCGNLFKFDEGEHVYAETLKSDDEYHWKECTICGYIKDKAAHVGGSATCLEKATCTDCGAKYSDVGSHRYDEVVDAKYLKEAATCTTKAVYYQSCTVCKEAHKTETFEAGEALGHDYVAVEEVAPKCEETGTKAHFDCSRCDVISLDKETTCEKADLVIPATGHKDVQVEKAEALKAAATCTTKAVYYESCEVCGKVNMEATFEVGEPLGHDYEAVVTAPTCTEKGYTTYTCKEGDDSYVGDYVDALGHNYEAVVTAPTCTEKGYTTYTCTEGDDSYVGDYVDALGHEYVKAEKAEALKAAATCTTKAVYYESCKVCGELNKEATFEAGEALGHDYKAVVTEPTCTEGGYTTYTCTRCNDTYKADEVEALGHDYKAVVTEPTCTEGGYTTYTCGRCNDTYKADEVEALGHTFAEVVKAETLKSEATCIAKAVYYKSCTTCGLVDKEATFETGEVDAANHVGETEVRDAKEAKCFEKGYTGDTYCKACDAKLETGKEIAKLPHSITTWVVTKEPTTTETGLKTGYCANKEAGCTEEHTVVIAKLVETGKEVVVESTEVKVESVVIAGESNVNESVVLQVENVTNTISEKETAAIEDAVKTLEPVEKEAEVIKVLDISMILREETEKGDLIEETEFELQGSVEIKIQLSDELVEKYENLVLVHVKDDGTVEVIPYTMDENNVVTFVANGFSYYTFVGTEKEAEVETPDTPADKPADKPASPVTSDNASIILWVALAAVALGAVVVLVFRRQRR